MIASCLGFVLVRSRKADHSCIVHVGLSCDLVGSITNFSTSRIITSLSILLVE